MEFYPAIKRSKLGKYNNKMNHKDITLSKSNGFKRLPTK